MAFVKRNKTKKMWLYLGLAALAGGLFYTYKKKLFFFAPKAPTAIKK